MHMHREFFFCTINETFANYHQIVMRSHSCIHTVKVYPIVDYCERIEKEKKIYTICI